MKSDATSTTYANIALIKYWGKRDTELNLPLNSSLSITVKCLKTETRIEESTVNTLSINNVYYPLNQKTTSLISKFNINHNIHIISINYFPTASGLASSASGYSAMVKSLNNYSNSNYSEQQLSILARQGSGSACRSIYNGFVVWNKGVETDGLDSFATLLYPMDYWVLETIIVIVDDSKKTVDSTNGMQSSVDSSSLLHYRLQDIPDKINRLTSAIKHHDFKTFCEIVKRESNEFHAICMSTYPPLFYLNDVSKSIINAVHGLNANGIDCCYTFDAGPNALVICLPKDLEVVEAELKKVNGVLEIK